jgi:hypothetical protein
LSWQYAVVTGINTNTVEIFSVIIHRISNSDVMGALPNDDRPEGFDRSDIIFYLVMAALFAFAIYCKHLA